MSLKRNVALYLIRQLYIKDVDGFFPEDRKIPLSKHLDLDGYVVLFQEDAQDAKWSDAIQYVSSPDSNPRTQQPGALIFIKYSSNCFIISFGTGWRHIETIWIQLNFGKLVALNSIPPTQLSGLKMEQVFSSWHQSTERSPLPTSSSKFDMEMDRDLVHAIEGVPSDKYRQYFGSQIKGGDALHFKLDFLQIKTILEHSLERYDSSDYSIVWPELNAISLIGQESEIANLNNELNKVISDKSVLPKIHLTCPLFKRTDLPIPQAFWIGKMKKNSGSGYATTPYLYMHSWEKHLEKLGEPPSVEATKKTTVHLFDGDGVDFHQVRFYDCLSYEIGMHGKQYFLSGGSWYEASIKLINRVEAGLKKIRRGDNSQLMAWDDHWHEGHYNEECVKADSTNTYLFDAKNISFGQAYSKFEFCDIYNHTNKKLYFVKNVIGSSSFSHLAEQIRRTVELLFSLDDEFRLELQKKISKLYPKLNVDWLPHRPNNQQLSLCIVSKEKDFDEFPFFAKLSLVKLHDELTRSGFDVEFINV